MRKRALIAALTAFPCLSSVSGIAVDRAGEIYFSDWFANRILRIDPKGAPMVVAVKHTHHLSLDRTDILFGEHATPDGSVVSLWRIRPQQPVEDVLAPAQREQSSYEGGAFVIDTDGSILTVKNCQLWRISGTNVSKIAGNDCGGAEWTHAELRFGHIHGTLALAPDGAIYFTDAKTVRRVTRDGLTATMDGSPVTLFAEPLPAEWKFDRALGLGVDSDGAIYVADSDRGVAKLLPGARLEWIYRSEPAWSPTGLAVRGGFVYIVENRPDYLKPFGAIIGSQRVRKLPMRGSAITVFTLANQALRMALVICVIAAAGLLTFWKRRLR